MDYPIVPVDSVSEQEGKQSLQELKELVKC